MAMDALGFWDVIKIAAGSGVVAAAMTFLLNLGKDWAKAREEAALNAVHLIGRLDHIAVQCANSYWAFRDLWDEAVYRGEAKNVSCVMPDFTVDRSLLLRAPKSIAAELAWLENEVSLGADVIRAKWNIDFDREAAVEADAHLVGYLGYRLNEISGQLKRTYALSYPNPRWGISNVEATLRMCHDETISFMTRET